MSTTRWLLRLVVAAALIASAVIGAAALESRADEPPLAVYVAPAGDDTADGRTPETAVASLTQAQVILDAERGDQAAEVRLACGWIVTQNLAWHHYHPDYPTSFVGSSECESTLEGADAGQIMHVRPASPASVDLHFSRIKFRNATNGLKLTEADDVTLDQVSFYLIGNKHTGFGMGYAALGVTTSDRVTVTDSSFTRIENNPGGVDDAALIHAVYAAHDSDNFVIRDSTFTIISGIPLKVRDSSDRMKAVRPTFTQTGTRAYMNDWYSVAGGEARSYSGELIDPVMNGGYYGDITTPVVCLDQRPTLECPANRLSVTQTSYVVGFR